MEEGTVFQPKPAGSLRPGVRLNDMFEIERLIAEGGMGEVYKGVSVASGDPVAIKLVRPEMARDPDVMALFKREAAILRTLLHDAIVRYYVFSVEPELQRVYIAMEFVDGVSLQKRLASGPLSLPEVRTLLKRIGAALEVAHESGVIHRDISSDNIILPNGDPRRAKIVDFGIARDARATEGTIIGGGFAGKYKYVSPEQLGLAGGVVTPKSDIYSFGLVIAEALRGKPIDMGTTQADVIEKRKRVPDLSDVDVALRPLLTAMLAPNPDDRPANMAEVAAWGETGERTTVAPAPGRTEPKKGGRLVLAATAAAVVVVALAAAAYFLRDRWQETLAPAPAPTATVALPKLPPLPTPTGGEASPTPAAAPPTPSQMESPTVDNLKAQLPPVAPPDVALAAVTVGAVVKAELPAFEDPGGKGLALHAAPSPPPGLTLHDLGNGRSTLQGTATTAGHYEFEVVAINHNDRSARMKVTLEVGEASKPGSSAAPAPAQASVDLEPATVGAPYNAPLPPFRSKDKLTLRADHPPDGLTFADLGGGLSQLAGAPSKPGRFTFDVVATSPSGGEGHMSVHMEVAPAAAAAHAATPSPVATTAPAPSPVPTPSVADGRAQVVAFLAARDASPCFFARFVDNDSLGRRFVGMGDDRAAFDSFAADYKKAFQRDPEIRAELVTPGQCPLVELMKLPAASAAPPPRLTLDSATVGSGRPLSGAVTELAQRSMILLAVGDDGRAVKVRAQIGDDGQSASFSLGITGDAASVGKPQLLVALVSDRPFTGLDTFRAGASADLIRKIEAQWRDAGAAATLSLFKLTN